MRVKEKPPRHDVLYPVTPHKFHHNVLSRTLRTGRLGCANAMCDYDHELNFGVMKSFEEAIGLVAMNTIPLLAVWAVVQRIDDDTIIVDGLQQ